MTWIDWVCVAWVGYVTYLSTLAATRQQLRIRGERELLKHQQQHRADFDWTNLKSAPPVHDSGLFWCIASGEIEAHTSVVTEPDGSVKEFANDGRSVFGITTAASVPIPGDPLGRHRVKVELGPQGFVDMDGWPVSVK